MSLSVRYRYRFHVDNVVIGRLIHITNSYDSLYNSMPEPHHRRESLIGTASMHMWLWLMSFGMQEVLAVPFGPVWCFLDLFNERVRQRDKNTWLPGVTAFVAASKYGDEHKVLHVIFDADAAPADIFLHKRVIDPALRKYGGQILMESATKKYFRLYAERLEI